MERKSCLDVALKAFYAREGSKIQFGIKTLETVFHRLWLQVCKIRHWRNIGERSPLTCNIFRVGDLLSPWIRNKALFCPTFDRWGLATTLLLDYYGHSAALVIVAVADIDEDGRPRWTSPVGPVTLLVDRRQRPCGCVIHIEPGPSITMKDDRKTLARPEFARVDLWQFDSIRI